MDWKEEDDGEQRARFERTAAPSDVFGLSGPRCRSPMKSLERSITQIQVPTVSDRHINSSDTQSARHEASQ